MRLLDGSLYKYLISNIFVASDLSLDHAATPVEHNDSLTQVEIRTFSDVHENAPKETISDKGFSFSTIDGLTFTVSGGTEISIFRADRITDTEVLLYLLGSAWGVLCHQRGLFPLHCSAVSIKDRAFAFVADSGGGKSTLAASLCTDDVRHVCDDVSIADFKESGEVALHAMPKGLKLWREASDALSLGRERLAVNENGREKYYVNPPNGPESSVLTLTGIYDIHFSETEDAPLIEPLSGVEALKSIYRNIYRVEWLDLLNVSDRALQQAHRIAAQVPVYRFVRPRTLERLVECSDFLEGHIRSQMQTPL